MQFNVLLVLGGSVVGSLFRMVDLYSTQIRVIYAREGLACCFVLICFACYARMILKRHARVLQEWGASLSFNEDETISQHSNATPHLRLIWSGQDDRA
jgi:hypothetical protein